MDIFNTNYFRPSKYGCRFLNILCVDLVQILQVSKPEQPQVSHVEPDSTKDKITG